MKKIILALFVMMYTITMTAQPKTETIYSFNTSINSKEKRNKASQATFILNIDDDTYRHEIILNGNRLKYRRDGDYIYDYTNGGHSFWSMKLVSVKTGEVIYLQYFYDTKLGMRVATDDKTTYRFFNQ